jgi:hypothetical protein
MDLFSNQPRSNASNVSNQKSGIVQQFLFPVILVILVYLGFLFCEIIYKYINRLSINRVELLPNTYMTDSRTVTITQNPILNDSKQINVSENERTGIEFSYSFYLKVNPSTFRQEQGLIHIFHKGYSSQFPLLAPGVYLRSDTNTLRVYMNTYKTWNNYIEVENIPLSKWVHICIVCKDNALEIYINGNLSKKLSFDGYAAYQNYQDVICFSQRRISLKQTIIPTLDDGGMNVFGSMKGMMSRLIYFNYALCYAEIQSLMSEGPSSKVESSETNDVPPYLSDTWWSQSY